MKTKKNFVIFLVLLTLFVSCSSLSQSKVPPTININFEKNEDLSEFEIIKGASISGNEKWSEFLIDNSISFEGNSSLKLSSNNETTKFYFGGIYLPIDKKSYKYECYVKGENIKLEGSQYNNAYVGFYIRYLNGEKKFVATKNNGTFNWRKESNFVRISDSTKIESIQFGIFLSKSGTMWVDNIKIYVD